MISFIRSGSFVAFLIACLVGSGCSGLRSTSSNTGEPPPLSLSITQSGVPVEAEEIEDISVEPVEESVSGTEAVATSYLRAGDPVVVYLRGIYPKDEMIEDIIDEQGNLSLPHIGDVVAAGKSTARLESDIRNLYINGGFYRTITVNVVSPQRSYFIRGEVRNPGRFSIAGGVTILQAIAAAGGYTEFASPRNVKLIRGGTSEDVNMRKIENNPELDVRLESGDVIVVGRSIL